MTQAEIQCEVKRALSSPTVDECCRILAQLNKDLKAQSKHVSTEEVTK